LSVSLLHISPRIIPKELEEQREKYRFRRTNLFGTITHALSAALTPSQERFCALGEGTVVPISEQGLCNLEKMSNQRDLQTTVIAGDKNLADYLKNLFVDSNRVTEYCESGQAYKFPRLNVETYFFADPFNVFVSRADTFVVSRNEFTYQMSRNFPRPGL
jgi:hypothetical protein